MTIERITDHVERALKRVIQQYKKKPFIEGMIQISAESFQELEDVAHAMFLNRHVTDAVGKQLDNFGTIVVQDREGFDDDFYRVLLNFKIAANTSRGIPEHIISAIKIISQSNLVHYQNLNNGNIGLSVDGTIDPLLINFVFSNMENVVMGGVNVNFIACFDPDEPFSFDGVGPVGLGFSSLATPTEGGKFAFLHRQTIPFAFAGNDTGALGFGTILDPLVGGVFQGL